MSKKNKQQGLRLNKVKKDSTFWISIFILILMVASLVAFGLSSSPGSSSSSQNTNQNIPFGQNFQNPDTGELYWGARINGESFIFFNIDGYDESLVESGLASRIKKQNQIEIFVDKNYTSTEAIYLVEKGLRGMGIGYIETDNVGVCNSNILVFTHNVSYLGDCMKFISDEDDAQLVANKVLYHLVKDFK